MATTFGKTDVARNIVINALVRGATQTGVGTLYLALFTVAPSNSAGGTEKAGGGYTRMPIAFGAPVAGASSNTGDVNFPNATVDYPANIVAAAVMDAAAAGNMLYFGPITAVRPLAGDNVRFQIGQVQISEQ